MLAGTELGFPALAAHVQAAAKHLVNITHGKGHMVQAAGFARQLQQENIVMPAIHRAAHEDAAPRVTV